MAKPEHKGVVAEQRVEVSTFSDEKKHLVTAHGDAIAQEALRDDLPPGYYTSGYFLGTTFVSCHDNAASRYSLIQKTVEVDSCSLADLLHRDVDFPASLATLAGHSAPTVSLLSTKSSVHHRYTFGFLWHILSPVPLAGSFSEGFVTSSDDAGSTSEEI
jgi:hypothetical protein